MKISAPVGMFSSAFNYFSSGLNVLGSITDGRMFEYIGIADVYRNVASCAKINVSKINRYIPLSKGDFITFAMTATTIFMGETSQTSWPNENMKVPIISLMAVLTYLSDTVVHNEKLAASQRNIQEFIRLLEELDDIIEEISIADDPWSGFIVCSVVDIGTRGLLQIWQECACMQITLKHNCGSISLYNTNHVTNSYKIISNIGGIAAFMLVGANVYLLANSGLSKSAADAKPTVIPMPSPTISSSLTNCPTAQPEIEEHITHLGSASAVPIRLALDLVVQAFHAMSIKYKQMCSQILLALEEELRIARDEHRLTSPVDFPSSVRIFIESIDLQDSSLIAKAKQLEAEYFAYKELVHAKAIASISEKTKEVARISTVHRFKYAIEHLMNERERVSNDAAALEHKQAIDEVKEAYRILNEQNEELHAIMEIINNILQTFIIDNNLPKAKSQINTLLLVDFKEQNKNLHILLQTLLIVLDKIPVNVLKNFPDGQIEDYGFLFEEDIERGILESVDRSVLRSYSHNLESAVDMTTEGAMIASTRRHEEQQRNSPQW